MPPSAPADHLACSEKPSASWRQRGGLAACGAALVFLASIHGDRGSGEKPCAAIGQGAAGRDDARGRPAAFRSAARPAAPGALMPTTAGFVVDEDGTGFSCLTWRFESRAQHTGQCAPRSLPARLGDLSPTSARRPHAHHQRAATAAHRARRLSALLTTRRRCPQACEAERRPDSARGVENVILLLPTRSTAGLRPLAGAAPARSWVIPGRRSGRQQISAPPASCS